MPSAKKKKEREQAEVRTRYLWITSLSKKILEHTERKRMEKFALTLRKRSRNNKCNR